MKNNTITSPKGFLAAGVQLRDKKIRQLDLGLIVCPTGAKAAAVFTTNKIRIGGSRGKQKAHKKPKDFRSDCQFRLCQYLHRQDEGIKNAIKMCVRNSTTTTDRKSKMENRK